MTHYVEVAVNVPTQQGVFHYHVPPEWEAVPAMGTLVQVPFGSQQHQGIVLGEVAVPEVPETKPLGPLLDPQPVLTRQQVELARWMSAYYRYPLGSSLEAMLPPGLSQHAESVYSLRVSTFESAHPTEQRLISLLGQRGSLRKRQLDHALPHVSWERDAIRLVHQGILSRCQLLPLPSVHPKQVRTVSLAIPPEQARELASQVRIGAVRPRARVVAERRAGVLEFLAQEAGPLQASWIYARSGANLEDLKSLAGSGWIQLGYEQVWRDPLAGREYGLQRSVTLNSDQERAWQAIRSALAKVAGHSFLLHGVTGSGKTEIYLRAASETLKLGRQVIVLVPEISLTAQTIERFGQWFPERMGVLHSRLSEGERYDTWCRARSGSLDVILGARSALFAPLPALGLIVVDEEHDDSYKSTQPPFFHARRMALEYARIAEAVCVLGSATPDLTTYSAARQGALTYLSLPARAGGPRIAANGAAGRGRGMPRVEIVDMRQELRAGNRSIFSRLLVTGLRECLERKEQAILFLNRRGSASAVFCRSCGRELRCPRCDIPLTLHGGQEPDAGTAGSVARRLICHHCNYRRESPKNCPHCGSSALRPLGVGTERIERELRAVFPSVRTLRWDRDTVRQPGAHAILLEHFASGRADVLVGTQMIAKGLDLPQVTLVGVILAEVGLYLPDYRAAERSFQVLTQVAGRAGRGAREGQAIFQTYQPEASVIQAAAAQDYEGFARKELLARKELSYPPSASLIRLLFVDEKEERALRACRLTASQLREKMAHQRERDTELAGPTPCFFAREAGRFRWQIVLRGPNPASLLPPTLPVECQVDVDPVSLL
ncbi:MAG: primosomal protein N' [Anaerolineales bacterium]|jgi:primosomal protein N' (replication factor Y)